MRKDDEESCGSKLIDEMMTKRRLMGGVLCIHGIEINDEKDCVRNPTDWGEENGRNGNSDGGHAGSCIAVINGISSFDHTF